MRGKVGMWQYTSTASGITPAYAGKRRLDLRLEVIRVDHPRVCGEKDI